MGCWCVNISAGCMCMWATNQRKYMGPWWLVRCVWQWRMCVQQCISVSLCISTWCYFNLMYFSFCCSCFLLPESETRRFRVVSCLCVEGKGQPTACLLFSSATLTLTLSSLLFGRFVSRRRFFCGQVLIATHPSLICWYLSSYSPNVCTVNICMFLVWDTDMCRLWKQILLLGK